MQIPERYINHSCDPNTYVKTINGVREVIALRPIAPGEDMTLRFVIFDGNDGAFDSAVLIDNFQWGATTVMGPSTDPIGYRLKRRRATPPALLGLPPAARTQSRGTGRPP